MCTKTNVLKTLVQINAKGFWISRFSELIFEVFCKKIWRLN